jgi:hypothetical protein
MYIPPLYHISKWVIYSSGDGDAHGLAGPNRRFLRFPSSVFLRSGEETNILQGQKQRSDVGDLSAKARPQHYSEEVFGEA